MHLITNQNPLILWQDVVKQAEKRCDIYLHQDLETYLILLLNRYLDKPEMAKKVLATAFLEAYQQKLRRDKSLQEVGDQCLLFAGLFPHHAERRHVKISYFVDLGRCAYASISKAANDLFNSLALEFVGLMDVLQSINERETLMPIEAYELWEELGSKRALKILRTYTKGIPTKNFRRH